MSATISREMLMRGALSDKNSPTYKSMCRLLVEAEAQDQRARVAQRYVVVPFPLSDANSSLLEKQFSIQIKVHGFKSRMVATELVQGFVFVLDSSLIELAGAVGDRVLFVDGDVMTMASLGVEGRIVERTHATPRLSAGYFMEGEILRQSATTRKKEVPVFFSLMLKELNNGGGEHIWDSIRIDGPEIDILLVNHFKTPIGPHQLAWLAQRRGAIVNGAIFFQHDMLVNDTGELECFPGNYYIDRDADVITLVPRDDATMSMSHPYSSWLEIIRNNSIVVDGKEFLCEKFNSVRGVVYYSLKMVGSDYEAPEVLRSHFFDSNSVGVVEVTYPKVQLSTEGVPVGITRGKSLILESRLEKVRSRLSTSTSAVITPTEVFTVLSEYNNIVVSDWNSLTTAQRMSVADEDGLSLALALNANWQRHRAKGTFNTLLSAIKDRYALKDASVLHMAYIAMVAWWSKPTVEHRLSVGELPVDKVVDFCGTDFSVVMRDVNPWVEFEQKTGSGSASMGRVFDWFPNPQERGKPLWVSKVVQSAKNGLKACGINFEYSEAKRQPLGKISLSKINRMVVKPKLAEGSLSTVTISSTETRVDREPFVETAVRSLAKHKLVKDQGAMNIPISSRDLLGYEANNAGGVGHVPVPYVDVVSAIESDFLMLNGGPVEYDAPAMGFRIAETEMSVNNTGVYSVLDTKREIPKPVWVRDPLVNLGVEGSRVGSQSTLFAASLKRNIGVPANRGTIDLDVAPALYVDKVIAACYREDWKEILDKHLDSGLWEPNVKDIENFLANADELKMKKLLIKFFNEGEVDLSKWMLMAKGKVKAARDVGGSSVVAHAQTILFQDDPGTNAMYSSMLRRFKEVTDECLRPEISLNTQRNVVDHEAWYNSLEPLRKSLYKTYSYSCDIKTYDRSQEMVALYFESEWYKRHGLNADRLAKWEVAHGPKRAINMMFGIVFTMVWGGVSGIFSTLYRNGIINLAVLVVAADLRRKDIVTLDVKGDDMDGEFSRALLVENAVTVMAKEFNLSAKFQTADVRYMCKEFRIRVNGRWYFMSDPWNRVQSLCTPIRMSDREADLKERFVSFHDGLRHYENGILVDQVAEAAQIFYDSKKPLKGFAMALSSFKDAGIHRYIGFYKAPRRIS